MGASEIISLLGGIALFLFGMAIMGDGLKKVAGSKLELVLYKLTSTPLKGLLLGTGRHCRDPVVLRYLRDGGGVCELRHDEGEPGHRHCHGRHSWAPASPGWILCLSTSQRRQRLGGPC